MPAPRSSAPLYAKPRSCAVCRSRKVRCDKQHPCSNCRRANIPCVVPSLDRPPRWARRLERVANTNRVTPDADPSQNADPGPAEIAERLRSLENLVRELSRRLGQAQAQPQVQASKDSVSGLPDPSTSVTSLRVPTLDRQVNAASGTSISSVHTRLGRLIIDDATPSRYVSDGFWSHIDDELGRSNASAQDLAGTEPDTSEDELPPGETPPSTRELGRTCSERHAFLFRHNLSPSGLDYRHFQPLPSQVLALVDTFSQNVNVVIQIVHMPTVARIARSSQDSDAAQLTPSDEALMFSIYYAAITSMEEEDVMRNFGSAKAELNLKFRLGFEYALAKADFLSALDMTLVQAFAVFLFLVRRHDTPRFTWMMTGLVIRMAQSLGMHRDGSHFRNLIPYEVEMRRRVWWALCLLDTRASEDQGTDFTIVDGSFDTRLPTNLDDADINPTVKVMPGPREGLTDMTISLVNTKIVDLSRQMMAPKVRDGPRAVEEQDRLLNEMWQNLEEGYLRHSTEAGNILYWTFTVSLRLVMGKMTLLTHLPVLFSSPSEDFSERIRNKLLISAIEVAEHNHELSDRRAARHWRWLFQTYTHWYAIVYLLIEVSRRPWSPIAERAWVALQSRWLIPAQSATDKTVRIWVPLRKMIAKARRHRDAELGRLRGDENAIRQLDMEVQQLPAPASAHQFSAEVLVRVCRERWWNLVTQSDDGSRQTRITPHSTIDTLSAPSHPASSQHMSELSEQYLGGNLLSGSNLTGTSNPPMISGRTQDSFQPISSNWPISHSAASGGFDHLWADADARADIFTYPASDESDTNMDLFASVDWYDWVESARNMELTGSSNDAPGAQAAPEGYLRGNW
ncbi:fungal-specific transcription factor domain-containing protein [Xylariomycetidae sp. FL2044]|nr:fungal-specific transcription factor domain-containing protein [Xylariomycetidae sp. FL2044]